MDYIQIDRTNCMELILQQFPTFQIQWDLHLESWNSLIARPIALDIAEFADFAVETICLDVDIEIDRLTATIELMLLHGDSTIEYAFRTMFLEQIAYRITLSGFPLDRFTHKLQPLGLYCWQAMDRNLRIYPLGVEIDPIETSTP
jgi:hypothetical protein